MTSLNLARNGLDDRVVPILCLRFLREELSQLRVLDISGGKISANGHARIAYAIAMNRLPRLHRFHTDQPLNQFADRLGVPASDVVELDNDSILEMVRDRALKRMQASRGSKGRRARPVVAKEGGNGEDGGANESAGEVEEGRRPPPTEEAKSDDKTGKSPSSGRPSSQSRAHAREVDSKIVSSTGNGTLADEKRYV